MEKVEKGVDLHWFWKNWFFDKNVPDLSIGKVKRNRSHYKVVINKIEDAIVPVHLTIIYKDETQALIQKDIGCWAKGNTFIILEFDAAKPIKKLVLGSDYDADINQDNNMISF